MNSGFLRILVPTWVVHHPLYNEKWLWEGKNDEFQFDMREISAIRTGDSDNLAVVTIGEDV